VLNADGLVSRTLGRGAPSVGCQRIASQMIPSVTPATAMKASRMSWVRRTLSTSLPPVTPPPFLGDFITVES